jgi:hypothetical protein
MPRGPRGAYVVEAAVLALVLAAIAWLASGCGASALRQHATAARLTMVALDTAGDAIVEGTQAAVDACPAPGDPARPACIEQVSEVSRAAAASRDALIAPAHAWRDAILAAAADPDSPDVMAALTAAASAIARHWASFAGALSALGVDVPAFAVPGAE